MGKGEGVKGKGKSICLYLFPLALSPSFFIPHPFYVSHCAPSVASYQQLTHHLCVASRSPKA